jgi:hypothetical protein
LHNVLVHTRHPGYRLVTKADALFPDGTGESEWQLTRSRHSDDVNAEVREAVEREAVEREDVERDGDPLFRIGLSLPRNSEIIKRSFA